MAVSVAVPIITASTYKVINFFFLIKETNRMDSICILGESMEEPSGIMVH